MSQLQILYFPIYPPKNSTYRCQQTHLDCDAQSFLFTGPEIKRTVATKNEIAKKLKWEPDSVSLFQYDTNSKAFGYNVFYYKKNPAKDFKTNYNYSYWFYEMFGDYDENYRGPVFVIKGHYHPEHRKFVFVNLMVDEPKDVIEEEKNEDLNDNDDNLSVSSNLSSTSSKHSLNSTSTKQKGKKKKKKKSKSKKTGEETNDQSPKDKTAENSNKKVLNEEEIADLSHVLSNNLAKDLPLPKTSHPISVSEIEKQISGIPAQMAGPNFSFLNPTSQQTIPGLNVNSMFPPTQSNVPGFGNSGTIQPQQFGAENQVYSYPDLFFGLPQQTTQQQFMSNSTNNMNIANNSMPFFESYGSVNATMGQIPMQQVQNPFNNNSNISQQNTSLSTSGQIEQSILSLLRGISSDDNSQDSQMYQKDANNWNTQVNSQQMPNEALTDAQMLNFFSSTSTPMPNFGQGSSQNLMGMTLQSSSNLPDTVSVGAQTISSPKHEKQTSTGSLMNDSSTRKYSDSSRNKKTNKMLPRQGNDKEKEFEDSISQLLSESNKFSNRNDMEVLGSSIVGSGYDDEQAVADSPSEKETSFEEEHETRSSDLSPSEKEDESNHHNHNIKRKNHTNTMKNGNMFSSSSQEDLTLSNEAGNSIESYNVIDDEEGQQGDGFHTADIECWYFKPQDGIFEVRILKNLTTTDHFISDFQIKKKVVENLQLQALTADTDNILSVYYNKLLSVFYNKQTTHPYAYVYFNNSNNLPLPSFFWEKNMNFARFGKFFGGSIRTYRGPVFVFRVKEKIENSYLVEKKMVRDEEKPYIYSRLTLNPSNSSSNTILGSKFNLNEVISSIPASAYSTVISKSIPVQEILYPLEKKESRKENEVVCLFFGANSSMPKEINLKCKRISIKEENSIPKTQSKEELFSENPEITFKEDQYHFSLEESEFMKTVSEYFQKENPAAFRNSPQLKIQHFQVISKNTKEIEKSFSVVYLPGAKERNKMLDGLLNEIQVIPRTNSICGPIILTNFKQRNLLQHEKSESSLFLMKRFDWADYLSILRCAEEPEEENTIDNGESISITQKIQHQYLKIHGIEENIPRKDIYNTFSVYSKSADFQHKIHELFHLTNNNSENENSNFSENFVAPSPPTISALSMYINFIVTRATSQIGIDKGYCVFSENQKKAIVSTGLNLSHTNEIVYMIISEQEPGHVVPLLNFDNENTQKSIFSQENDTDNGELEEIENENIWILETFSNWKHASLSKEFKTLPQQTMFFPCEYLDSLPSIVSKSVWEAQKLSKANDSPKKQMLPATKDKILTNLETLYTENKSLFPTRWKFLTRFERNILLKGIEKKILNTIDSTAVTGLFVAKKQNLGSNSHSNSSTSIDDLEFENKYTFHFHYQIFVPVFFSNFEHFGNFQTPDLVLGLLFFKNYFVGHALYDLETAFALARCVGKPTVSWMNLSTHYFLEAICRNPKNDKMERELESIVCSVYSLCPDARKIKNHAIEWKTISESNENSNSIHNNHSYNENLSTTHIAEIRFGSEESVLINCRSLSLIETIFDVIESVKTNNFQFRIRMEVGKSDFE